MSEGDSAGCSALAALFRRSIVCAAISLCIVFSGVTFSTPAMALKVGDCRDADWLRTYIRLSVAITTGASAEGDFLVIVRSASGRLTVFRLSEDGRSACILAHAEDVTDKDGPLKDLLDGKRSH